MSIKPKPGNQPDAGDMAAPLPQEGGGADVASTHPNLEQEEEEAARLGDFA